LINFVTILFLTVKLSVLYGFGFYRRYWRYASIDELTQITMLMCADSYVFVAPLLGDSPEKNRDRYRCLTEFSAW